MQLKIIRDVDQKFINKFELLSQELLKIKNVNRVFSFIDAPILFLNNASLNTLSADNIETLKNSKYNVSDVLKEFSNNPIYKDQIVNNKSNVFSLIIYLEKI